MFDLYKNYFIMGSIDADFLRDVILLMPAMGLTPLDYEKITGQDWPDKKEDQ